LRVIQLGAKPQSVSLMNNRRGSPAVSLIFKFYSDKGTSQAVPFHKVQTCWAI
jgi:hypothetical protein